MIIAMRNALLALLTAMTATICLPAHSQDQSGPLSLIPAPASLELAAGRFTLPSSISVEAPNQAELTHAVEELKTRLSTPTGYTVTISHEANPSATIRLT